MRDIGPTRSLQLQRYALHGRLAASCAGDGHAGGTVRHRQRHRTSRRPRARTDHCRALIASGRRAHTHTHTHTHARSGSGRACGAPLYAEAETEVAMKERSSGLSLLVLDTDSHSGVDLAFETERGRPDELFHVIDSRHREARLVPVPAHHCALGASEIGVRGKIVGGAGRPELGGPQLNFRHEGKEIVQEAGLTGGGRVQLRQRLAHQASAHVLQVGAGEVAVEERSFEHVVQQSSFETIKVRGKPPQTCKVQSNLQHATKEGGVGAGESTVAREWRTTRMQEVV